MNMKSKFAALSAALIMIGSAEAAVVTYEVSEYFSSYNNNSDGSGETQPGGGLLSGVISFDGDTGAFISAQFTSFLPGPGARTSVYDTEADAMTDGVATSLSRTGNALTFDSDYAYATLNGAYLPQHNAVLGLDFGSSSIGDATISATLGEVFNTYGLYDTVYGPMYSKVTFGSQYGQAMFTLVDPNATDPGLETPLPAAFPLMACGLAFFGAARRRRTKTA